MHVFVACAFMHRAQTKSAVAGRSTYTVGWLTRVSDIFQGGLGFFFISNFFFLHLQVTFRESWVDSGITCWQLCTCNMTVRLLLPSSQLASRSLIICMWIITGPLVPAEGLRCQTVPVCVQEFLFGNARAHTHTRAHTHIHTHTRTLSWHESWIRAV